MSSGVLATLFALLLASAIAQQFYTNTRYGKKDIKDVQGPRLGRYSRNGKVEPIERVMEIVPRTDSFFWGPRYGKRSSTASLTASASLPSQIITSHDQFTCLYTGLTNLYRCFSRKDNVSGLLSNSEN